MALVSKRTYMNQYAIHLINRKFIHGDPNTYNVIIPLNGTFFYLGTPDNPYDPDDYQKLSRHDVLLSTPGHPDFLYTFDDESLILVLTIPRDHFRTRFKSNLVGYTIVMDEVIQSKILAIVGNLCAIDRHSNEGNRDRWLDLLIQNINDTLIGRGLNSETNSNLEVVMDVYDLLQTQATRMQSLNDILDTYRFSRSYVSSKFKQVTGVNLIDYLRLYRVAIAFNNLSKSTEEIVYLGNFRNPKVMKDSLKLITGKSFRRLQKKTTKSTITPHMFDSPLFLDFIEYAQTLSPESEEPLEPFEPRDVIHQVSALAETKPFVPVWKSMGDFKLFSHVQRMRYPRLAEEDIERLGFKAYRLEILCRQDGTCFLDMGKGELIAVDEYAIRDLYSEYGNTTDLVLSLDFISLNRKAFRYYSREEFNRFVKNMIASKRLSRLAYLLHQENIHNIRIEFSLGRFLKDKEHLKENIDKASDFLQVFLSANDGESIPRFNGWGLYFDEFSSQETPILHEFMESLEKKGPLPQFISLGIDEQTTGQESKNLEYLLYSYEKILEHLSASCTTIRERWNVKLYATKFSLYFDMSDLSDGERNMLMKTIFIDGVFIVSKVLDGCPVITVKSGDHKSPVELFTPHGFKTLLYHAMAMLNDFKGEILYAGSECLILKDSRDFFALLYSGIEESYQYSQDPRFLNYTWKNTLKIDDAPGMYKITTRHLDGKHGNYVYTLKDFVDPQFLTSEEWHYVNRHSEPKYTSEIIESDGTIEIQREMWPFDAHFFHIERIG